MNELLVVGIAMAWFLAMMAVQFWMMGRINAQIRDRASEIERLKKAIALVDDMDDRLSKVRARSKENEGDILRTERHLKRLSNTINSQAAREQAMSTEVALQHMADYIQSPDQTSNEQPAPTNPEDELGYRG